MTSRAMQVMLVDPSLFTGPYDAALHEGLVAAGVTPTWMTRPTRIGDSQELPPAGTDPFFYRRTDEARWPPARLKPVVKGLAHLAGLAKLLWKVHRAQPDVVHFQWTVVPLFDSLAMAWIARRTPLVLTVHDTVPFNGERMSWLQNAGFDLPMRMADRLIVHTETGRRALIERGVPAQKIVVVPHGPLRLRVPLPPRSDAGNGRYMCLLFGEIKPYKGLDVLVEALGMLPTELRSKVRVIVAGRARMDLDPVRARIVELGLGDAIELRPERQTEQQMAQLFVDADCFLFPYRQIDASGVWYLTKSFGKWAMASAVGVFAAELQPGRHGALLPPGDAVALARAIEAAVRERPQPVSRTVSDEWAVIGAMTRGVYESLLPARAAQPEVLVQP